MTELKFIDLFAGTGAFSYIMEKHGHKCVFANDMIKESQQIYEINNNNTVFLLEDINGVNVNEIPKHDILCGGFPCQPFSIAGLQRGFADTRSNAFWKVVEILKTHKPRIIILENVKNLVTHDNCNTFKIIQKNLTKLGYKIKYKILNTCEITDIPQHRERIYIVGFLDDADFDNFSFDFEPKENKKLIDLLELNIPNKYYYTSTLKVYDTIKAGVIKHINTNTIYQYRRYYVRENKSNCCPTLTANMGSGGHNVPIIMDDKGIRKLTPRECFNLQGFPKEYQLPNLCDSKLYKLAGNAVSIPVIELIIKKISKQETTMESNVDGLSNSIHELSL